MGIKKLKFIKFLFLYSRILCSLVWLLNAFVRRKERISIQSFTCHVVIITNYDRHIRVGIRCFYMECIVLQDTCLVQRASKSPYDICHPDHQQLSVFSIFHCYTKRELLETFCTNSILNAVYSDLFTCKLIQQFTFYYCMICFSFLEHNWTCLLPVRKVQNPKENQREITFFFRESQH